MDDKPPPILRHKDHEAPSVFAPDGLLREARRQERPQGGGVFVFGNGQTVPGQRSTRGGVGVERVRLALTSPCGPIGAVDLGNFDPGVLQGAGQPRAV